MISVMADGRLWCLTSRMSFVSRSATAVSLSVLLAATSGCQSKPSDSQQHLAAPLTTPAPVPVAPDPAADARQLFRTRCTACHGDVGRGDGPGAAALTPKPRAFADAAWQSSVKDEELREAIVKGGAAIGKSPGMPANPDLAAKPDVVRELIAIVRAFKS